MQSENPESPGPSDEPILVSQWVDTHIARRVLIAFIATFIASRVLVILIMTGRMPDLYLHVGKGRTHIHHLNYGIFLLAIVGGLLLFVRLSESWKRFIALLYGVGLALTFDEFGMWVHLGGSYWQRASYDAVITVGSLLALIVVAPKLKRMRPIHWLAAIAVAGAALVFGGLLIDSLRGYAHSHNWPSLTEIEISGPQ